MVLKLEYWNDFKRLIKYYVTDYRIYWVIGIYIRPYKIYKHFAQFIALCLVPTIFVHVVCMVFNWNLEFVIENAILFSFHVQVTHFNN